MALFTLHECHVNVCLNFYVGERGDERSFFICGLFVDFLLHFRCHGINIKAISY